MIMNKFPVNLQRALEVVSLEHKMSLLKETHYEAINRELRWMKASKLYRIDFNLDTAIPNITATLYVEEYPLIFSAILIWWNNHIRLFPYRAKIKWDRLVELSTELTEDEYKNSISRLLNPLLNPKKS